ncbi:tyrosine recombinase XerC [Microbispora rosea]|uniref:tyrosine recombinase XerC n=1 Tax=Microbispora rosea TaxID=58117 RepID=UPI0037A3ED5B
MAGGWRARWRGPTGTVEQSSPIFPSERAAKKYANDQEARIRDGRYVDPKASNITLEAWVNLWFPSLDLEPTTLSNYRYAIEVHILPAFGPKPLSSITPEQVAAWEKNLVQVAGYSPRTAKDARVTFATCLSAAVPHRIPMNPAARPKAKGRRGVSRAERALAKKKKGSAIPTPLEALVFAERVAALSGQDDDFIREVLYAFMGVRWGEALALGPGYLTDEGLLDIQEKLYELSGKFYRGIPKDGSVRQLDVPPFLAELLAGLKPRRCTCTPRERRPGEPSWCQGGEYLFLGPEGGHPRRSNFGRRFVRPAADGWYPQEGQEGGKTPPKPARPVLVDLTQGWPGIPIVPWPAAVRKQPFVAPRLAERTRGRKTLPEGTPIASWVPVRHGMTTHGLRHANQTWMGEDRIADVLRDERMGHSVEDDQRMASAMRDHYTHVSEVMRAEAVEALQRRWETALAQRAEMERVWAQAGVPRRSTVPLVDRLLQPYRDATVSAILQPRTLRRRSGRLAARGQLLAETGA